MTSQEFAIALLQALGLPVTDQTVTALMTWCRAEGGAGPQWGIPGNIASFNPLNTTLRAPGSQDTPGNVPPVQAYVSWGQGVAAIAATLRQENMAGIVAALAAGADCAQLSAAVTASPWGTGPFAHLCGLTSVQGPPPAAPPAPAPQPTSGGTDVQAPTLRQGSTGKSVRAVQLLLNDGAGARLTVDGTFGPLTEAAVRAWQTFWRVAVDGVVGPVTWGLLVAWA